MVETVVRILKASPALIALAATLALAPPAQAGRYHVYSCRTPSGEVAPTDGWSGSVAAGGAHTDTVIDTCAEGGALIAAIADNGPNNPGLNTTTWAFDAPPGATIAGATLWRAGDTAGGGNAVASYQLWYAGPTPNVVFDACAYTLGCDGVGEVGKPFAAANRFVIPTANLGPNLYVDAGCREITGSSVACQAGMGDGEGYAVAMRVYAADIVLEQPAGPTVGDVGGELSSAPTLQGESEVSFTAADPGAGVWEAVVEVDGQIAQTALLDGNGGRCRDVGQTTDGLPAFLYTQPCISSVRANVALDTTKLTNGKHHVVVDVLDAAGNATAVIDRTVQVDNAPSPCAGGATRAVGSSPAGSLKVAWKGSKKPDLTSGFGAEQTILGTLTGPTGAPVAGVPISLTQTPVSGGASVAMSAGRTSASGRFTVRVAGRSASSRLCLAYQPPGGAAPLEVTLELRTRAGIALHVSPHTTSVGHAIHFTGRLLAGPVPPGGKSLVLEARAVGGHWIEFDVIHTGPRGRFRSGYRFKFEGPVSYQFRAVSEAEADYPYAEGSSNVVRVFER